MPSIDPGFLALPLGDLSDAALTTARDAGATYADFRLERIRDQRIAVKDRDLRSLESDDRTGYCVRLIVDGAWGFAFGSQRTSDAVAATASRAVEVARALARLNTEPVELAPEPSHQDTFVSAYEVDPFEVSDEEKVAFLLEGAAGLLASSSVEHVDAAIDLVRENKFFANLDGTRLTQQRVRGQGAFYAVAVLPDGGFESMRTIAMPAGHGWEYFAGGAPTSYDWASDLDALPERLAEKVAAPTIEPGDYDLVIHPTNLWLTIHESIGHSTELDRALGYEANYAGTSFATLDKLDTLNVGSAVMHVTGDRVVDHGLSTIGYDDEGVAAQRWDIIRDGVLVGYQLNRQMAQKQGFGRSNGCAFSDGPDHIPLQRMPNVSLQPGADDTSTDDLIGGVEDGLYIVGDNSWSIDMQRYNFQFTGQRFYRIKGGALAGQVKDVAYQSNTIQFWNKMEAVGGPGTYILGGAFNCGKGQPGQIAPVSHGCPTALFRDVSILNTRAEG